MSYLLSDIIREYCIEIGDYNFNRAPRFYQFATAGFRELSMDVTAVPKSKELFLDKNGEVDLPDGFLNYISISVIGQDGLLWGLAKNNSINTTTYYNKCGEVIRPNPPVPTVGNFQGWGIGNPTYLANHWLNAENIGAYFNVPSTNLNGSYKIDYERNRIFLYRVRNLNIAKTEIGGTEINSTNECPRSVIFEYISDISSNDDDFMIHPFIIESIKAWIYWKNIQRDRNFSIGDKQLAEMAYTKARKQSIHRYMNGTMDEWLTSMRKIHSAIPKW